jgi:hypothetical protein
LNPKSLKALKHIYSASLPLIAPGKYFSRTILTMPLWSGGGDYSFSTIFSGGDRTCLSMIFSEVSKVLEPFTSEADANLTDLKNLSALRDLDLN